MSGRRQHDLARAEAGYDPAEHYDRVTGAWQLLMGEELHYGIFDHGDEPLDHATAKLTSRMAAAAELDPGLRVLDVGCGIGFQAGVLQQQYGAEVVGITNSGVGLKSARERAADIGLEHVSFELRDGTDNGFPDDSFDRVWVLESSHLMRERDRLISECARVLRPGGRLVLCDLIRRRDIPFLEVRDNRFVFATLRAAFGDAHMESLDFYAAASGRHGLVVERVQDLTTETLPTFEKWRRNAESHREEVTATIGADGLEAFEESCDILESFWRDGTFGYGLVSAAKPR